VNVDNDTLRRIMDNPEAMAAVERIEGWRSLGDNTIETIINKSEKVKALKNKGKVSKDIEHKPMAKQECRIMLVKPKGTVNTGDTHSDLTAQNDVWIESEISFS